MRKLLFLAFLLAIAGSLSFLACGNSVGSSDDDTEKKTGDDSSADDSAIDDDTTNLDDDGFPSNIELFGGSSMLTGEPYSSTSFDSVIMKYSLFNWEEVFSWVNFQIQDLWGSSPSDLYSVGVDDEWSRPADFLTRRCLTHLQDITCYPDWPSDSFLWRWASMYMVEWTLNGIYGTSDSDIYSIGTDISADNYSIFHYNGINWSIEKNYPGSQLSSIWASKTGLVVIVGSICLTKENGLWHETDNCGGTTVWGAPDDVVFAANGRTVYRYQGGDWELMNTPELESVNLYKLSGFSSTDIYGIGWSAGGNNSTVLVHYDGVSWSMIAIPIGDSDSTYSTGGLWVAAHDSVFISIPGYYNPYGRTLYYDGHSWHTLSNEKGPQILWGFVNS